MKLPWIRLPTLAGLGTETPMPNPSMISPLKTQCEASSTKPVPSPVWLPSMMTRIWALLPSMAAVVLGTEVIMTGSPVATPP